MKYSLTLSAAAFLLATSLLSSCVTMSSNQFMEVNIQSDKGAKLVYDSANYRGIHTLRYRGNLSADNGLYSIPGKGLNIVVPRSRTFKLPVTIQKDSVSKTVYLRPGHNPQYYNNIGNYGIGFAVDCNNPNRFGYRSKVYVNMDDPQDLKAHRFAPRRKNDFTFNLSVPYVNFFYFNEGTATTSAAGFWGISAGGNYYYANNKFVSAQAGVAINLPLPFPAAIDYFGDTITKSNLGSLFLNIKDNYTRGRFDFGYGLSVSSNYWREMQSIRDTGRHYTTTLLHNYANTSIGGAFSAYYRLGKTIHVGLLYQPYLLSMKGAPLMKYEHTITLDVMWRFGFSSAR